MNVSASPHLHFLWLEVSDLARSTIFYRDHVGLKVTEENEAFITLDMGQPQLYLAVGEPRPASMYLALAVADVDALYARLQQAGAEVTPPQDEGWARYIEFTDPDGYRWLALTPTEPSDTRLE